MEAGKVTDLLWFHGFPFDSKSVSNKIIFFRNKTFQGILKHWCRMNDKRLNVEILAVPMSGEAPLTVEFSLNSDDNIVKHEWIFGGDGKIDSVEKNPIKVFDIPGNYKITLTVTDCTGIIETISEWIMVLAPKVTALEDDKFYDSRNALITGVLQSKYKDGGWAEFEVKDGVRNGFYLQYFKNGIIEKRLTFVEGRAHGQGIEYFENGSVSIIQNHKDGLKEGLATSFYENGKQHSISHYQNGKREGVYQSYFDDGRLKIELLFKDDKIIDIIRFNTIFNEEFLKISSDDSGNKKGSLHFGDKEMKYTVDGFQGNIFALMPLLGILHSPYELERIHYPLIGTLLMDG